jgi:hypothetical protein
MPARSIARYVRMATSAEIRCPNSVAARNHRSTSSGPWSTAIPSCAE